MKRAHSIPTLAASWWRLCPADGEHRSVTSDNVYSNVCTYGQGCLLHVIMSLCVLYYLQLKLSTLELSIAVLVSYPSSASELGAGGVMSPFWMVFALYRILESILPSYKRALESLRHLVYSVHPCWQAERCPLYPRITKARRILSP